MTSMALFELYLRQVAVFVLVLTRVSGLVMTAPVFGSRNVPLRVRALLAIALALLITPLQGGGLSVAPGNLLELLLLVGREALLGLALGLSVLILFTSLQLTGQLMGQISGMSLADVFDPSYETDVSIFSQLLDLVAVAVFLAIGGHRQVLAALLDTFQNLPVGSCNLPSSVVPALVELLGESFEIGLRAAAPVMLALLLSVLILGLISRTLPQLNVIAVGFSLNGLIMLAALALCLGAMVQVLVPNVEGVIQRVHAALVSS